LGAGTAGDVKAENIMRAMAPDGTSMIYKLIDFSIAAVSLEARDSVSSTLRTGTSSLAALIGTPHAMSPEQFREGTCSIMITVQSVNLYTPYFSAVKGVK
jgi:serine/threonine protein kinase